MSQPKPPSACKLVIRFLYREDTIQLEALRKLNELFGPADFLSDAAPFPYTNYYEREMGRHLKRRTASYLGLVAPDSLAAIKHRTNRIELDLSEGGARTVNIDPGFLSEERFVLATGKNFTHRIYLGEGIYADLTLIYQRGAYRPLSWTYPDYREPEFLHALAVLRKKLRFQLGGALPDSPPGPPDVSEEVDRNA